MASYGPSFDYFTFPFDADQQIQIHMGMDFGCDQLSSWAVWGGWCDGGKEVFKYFYSACFLVVCPCPGLSYWAGIPPETLNRCSFYICTVLCPLSHFFLCLVWVQKLESRNTSMRRRAAANMGFYSLHKLLKGIDMVKSWPGPGQKYNLLYSTA